MNAAEPADDFECSAEKFGEMAALFLAICCAADTTNGKMGHTARFSQITDLARLGSYTCNDWQGHVECLAQEARKLEAGRHD